MTKQNEDDACIWYLINVLLDTLFCIILIWMLIKLSNSLAKKLNLDFLISGNYFRENSGEEDDYNIDYKIWVFQTFLYLIYSLIAKSFSFGFQFYFPDELDKLGKFLVSCFIINPKLELIIVMIIIPLITTCIQFWIIDNLLKESYEHKCIRSSNIKISPLVEVEKKGNDVSQTNIKIFSNSSSSDIIIR